MDAIVDDGVTPPLHYVVKEADISAGSVTFANNGGAQSLTFRFLQP